MFEQNYTYYLDVWFLQQLEQLLVLRRDVRFGRQLIEDLDVDVHRVRQHGKELVVLNIVEDFVVNVHEGVEFLGLQQLTEKPEFLLGAAGNFRLVLLQRVQQLGQRWNEGEKEMRLIVQ